MADRRARLREALIAYSKSEFAAREDSRLVAPVSPTPASLIDRCLEALSPPLSPEDVVFDLGCGDGRWLVQASLRSGCRGVGLELDDGRIELARERVREHGLEERVAVRKEDIFEADVSGATLIVVYLFSDALERLRGKLVAEAPDGCRVVSVGFRVPGWPIEGTEREAGAPPLFRYARAGARAAAAGDSGVVP